VGERRRQCRTSRRHRRTGNRSRKPRRDAVAGKEKQRRDLAAVNLFLVVAYPNTEPAATPPPTHGEWRRLPLLNLVARSV
jgi:hypothetical protein